MIPSKKLVFILAAKLLLLLASADTNPPNYRLPKFYDVLNYNINLDLNPKLFTPNGTEFSGRVEIRLKFTKVVDYISLHADHKMIKFNKISFENAKLHPSNYSVNNDTNILTIHIGNQVATNTRYLLVIEYTGTVADDGLVGLYKSSYVNKNNETKYLLTTQLASTYARMVFPCFDEPGFKSHFDFAVTFPTGLNALFNTQEINKITNTDTGLTTLIFKTTPYMSTYILALVVSDLTCTSRDFDKLPVRVCSRDELASLRHLALHITPKILASMNNFTDYNYNRLIEKLDLVAVPDFSSGAMENWGLIIYRESELLYDSEESPNEYKEEVIIVIAHELAHQWFGNLVTFHWWSEIFMNEGLATYFQYYITDQVIPAYEFGKRVVLDSLHTVLIDDGGGGVLPLRSENITTTTEIDAAFNKVSYHKGGSIIRMVQNFLSMNSFRIGIRNYISVHQYMNVDSEDLWFALSQTHNDSISKMPANLSTIMQNWIREPGYPLVNVSLDGDLVTLSQIKFSYFGLDSKVKWYIPISYTTSDQSKKFESTTPDVWLTPESDMHAYFPPNCNWIVVNNQQIGYYRVHYDKNLWKKIKTALGKENFDGIIDLNRAQIVDDLFNLARADIVDYSFALNTVRFLKNDTSYYSWEAALEGYELILRRVGEYSELGKAIGKDVLSLIDKFYNTVSISNIKEDDHFYTLKQVLAGKWACRLGHVNCTKAAIKLFKMYKESGKRPSLELRSIIYCNGLRYSNDADDWYFMWDAYLKAGDQPSEQEIIRMALGCTRNTTLLRNYLKKSIDKDSGIRSQDTLTVFTAVGGNPDGVDVAFNFLIENQEFIVENYQSSGSLEYIFVGISDRFTSKEQIKRLKNIVISRSLKKGFKEYGIKALAVAEATGAWLDKYSKNLEVYYKVDKPYHLLYLLLLIPLFIILGFSYYMNGRREVCLTWIVNMNPINWVLWLRRRRNQNQEPAAEPEEVIPMQEIPRAEPSQA